MADDPVNSRPLPFNIPEGIDALKARDPEFWAAHRRWREAEDYYNGFCGDRDDDPQVIAFGTRATEMLDALLAMPVRTASALLVKLEALREGYSGDAGVIVAPGLSALQCFEWDVERIAKGELWGPAAFQDMAED